MDGTRSWRRRGVVLAATVAAGAGLAVGASTATAQSDTGSLLARAGGYRNTADNLETTFAFGLEGATLEASGDKTFTTTTPFPLTDPAGLTTLSGLPFDDMHYVREQAAPAGWSVIRTLNFWGGDDGNNLVGVGWPDTPPDEVQIGEEPSQFIYRLDNPQLPANTCARGLRVSLVLDTSGSTSGSDDAYNAAAKAFINSLAGTSTSVRISSFSDDVGPGTATFDLSTPAGQAGALARIDDIYPNNTSGDGSTNWDAALQDAATADNDVVVVVTDGNPTTRQGGSGGGDYFDIAYGMASANLAKDADRAPGGRQQTILAVGVGSDLAVENLIAISGPIEGTDYTTASDPSALAGVLTNVTHQLCPTPPAPTPAPAVATEPPVALRPATGLLQLKKTVAKSSLAGGPVTFKMTVKNTGSAPLTGVVITDTTPRSMVLSATPAGASRTGRRIAWTVGDLAPGQSVTKDLPVRLLRTVRGRTCNTAFAVADGLGAVRSTACTAVLVGRRPATPVTG